MRQACWPALFVALIASACGAPTESAALPEVAGGGAGSVFGGAAGVATGGSGAVIAFGGGGAAGAGGTIDASSGVVGGAGGAGVVGGAGGAAVPDGAAGAGGQALVDSSAPVDPLPAPSHAPIGLSYTYPKAYADWANALLAGNGKMGIMVFGNPLSETIVFNDRGFNMAKGADRSFAEVSAADLATIKNECAAGNFAAANQLAVSSAKWNGGGEGNRHPGFKMSIVIPQSGTVTNYSRSQDYRTGETTVKWTDGRGDWVRKAFVSRKDNVTVVELTAPTNGAINAAIGLSIDDGMLLPSSWPRTNVSTVDTLNIRVAYSSNTNGAGYEGVTRIVTAGGTKSVANDVLTIADARSVLMLTRTAKYYSSVATEWGKQAIQAALGALPADYATLLAGQVATHGAIYDRVSIDLFAPAADRAKANEELLAMQKASSTPVRALWERVFDAGRYLYLSSSSELTPPDLLGIWTGDSNAGWGGFYHLDANLNVQIASGNVGNMPEAMEGYFKINEAWQPDFRTNAKKLLGCRGMVAGGNTPGPTTGLMATISDYYPYQYATGEEGWLLYPFWEHYLVAGDTAFLKDRLFPLLRDMGDFYEDFLKLTDANGKFIFAGSVSPENQPPNVKVSLLNNSTFDISAAKFCLTSLVQAANTLGLEQGPAQGVERWTAIINKLPYYLVNADGALQEWAWPGLGESYGHRHSSGLLPVWPFREITPEATPALYKAASTTLEKKDMGSYENAGHGILHAALIAANLKNDRSVAAKLTRLTKEDFYYDSLASSHYNAHNTFCTDTCNAVPGIMMEMLVSSSPGIVELLPALPKALDHGAISGLKGRTRVTVQDLRWDMTAGSVSCTLKSDVDQSITLIERKGIDAITTTASVRDSPLGAIARVVALQAGVSTKIAIGIGQGQGTNLAFGRPATASSVADNSPAANAVDGDMSTRWSSAYTDNEWIYVDLGKTMALTGARLVWEAGYALAYKIQVSGNALDWTDVYSTTAGDGGTDDLVFKASGRYVRMLGIKRASTWGYSLYEFEVNGSAAAADGGVAP
jgi:alpha-L-fucosidase 2